MQNGDESALELVYYKFAEIFYQYGLKFTQHSDVIEDAIQELFLSFIRKKTFYPEPENISSYLLRAFRNQLIKEIKHKNNYQDIETIEEEVFSVSCNLDKILSKEEINHRQKILLTELVKSLSSRQKEAIYLKYKNGLNNDEIAEVMAISNQACRNLISGAIKRMNKFWSEMKISKDSVILIFF